MLLLPEIKLSSPYPTSCVAVGWRLGDPPRFPRAHPFQGGVDGLWPWQWQGGPGTCNLYTCSLLHNFSEIQRLWCLHWHSLPCQTTHVLPHSKRQLLKLSWHLKILIKNGSKKEVLIQEDPPVLGLTARFRFTICLSKQICQLDGLE